jgi:hypothetical protein
MKFNTEAKNGHDFYGITKKRWRALERQILVIHEEVLTGPASQADLLREYVSLAKTWKEACFLSWMAGSVFQTNIAEQTRLFDLVKYILE